MVAECMSGKKWRVTRARSGNMAEITVLAGDGGGGQSAVILCIVVDSTGCEVINE